MSNLLPLQRCITYRKLCAERPEVNPVGVPVFEPSYVRLANWNGRVSLNMVFIQKFLQITIE